MADHHLFVWQRSLSIGLVATAVGFMTGFNLPVNRSLTQTLSTPKTLLLQRSHLYSSTSYVKTLIAQPDESYNKLIPTLSLATKVRCLNSPIPDQFQGKTIRYVRFDNQDKAIAQEASAKEIAPNTISKSKDTATSQYPIALTFDDGPWSTSTSQILNILKKNKVKATFFMVGKQVQKYPQLVKQVVAEGHAIGNHTWSHQYHFYNDAAVTHELEDTATLIYKTTGVQTSLFRPPAGILNNGLVAYAHAKKYAVIMWSIDSRDWRYYSSTDSTGQGLVESVLKDAKPGGIVLMHDGGGDRSTTVKALPSLIAKLKQHGYKLVTVPELLEMGDKEVKGNKI